jgi:hypothetical protein
MENFSFQILYPLNKVFKISIGVDSEAVSVYTVVYHPACLSVLNSRLVKYFWHGSCL